MNTQRFVLLALVVLACLPVRIVAQSDDESDGRGRRRIEELRRIKLIEALDLKEDQAVRLMAREREFRQSERQQLSQRKSSIDRLQTLVASGAGDAELQAQIDRVLETGKDIMQRRRDYLLSLRDILSMNQIARLVVFEDTFQRELRDIIRKAHARDTDH